MSAREDALQSALNLCMTGGNHIASQLIHRLGPDFCDRLPPNTDAHTAQEALGDDVLAYDLWCCWAMIMRARDIMWKANSES